MCNDNSNFFKPADASRASRRITLKSSVSSRGFIPNHTGNCWASYESTLERDFLTIVRALPDVKRVEEQPEPVTYVDGDGKRRKHTFDFVIYLTTGEKFACDIKPENRLARSGIKEVHHCIRKQRPNYADRFLVRTDRKISRVLVRNSELILRARNLKNEEAIGELRQHLATMHGVFRLAALVAHFSEEAIGFNAVLNLIDLQELKPVTRGPINDDTELQICLAA
ncbi:TnsA endonuclease N-terminal domain-containing protein [Roseibium sp. SCP14]|uniref:TnsA endonuclease N-terminal domain-containing protein n=1 Tax=Roseibium sp. SCP14 TaxID=3141375 RepID=UPI00333D81A9